MNVIMFKNNRKGEYISRIKTIIELVLVALVISGCSSTQKLMPTPNIYSNGGGYPESSVAQELKSNKVDVLFVTDRKPGEPERPLTHKMLNFWEMPIDYPAQ
jgi:hypothetical protein